ncbi:hypothetical protein M1L60_28740 [Actinoplanes sp. TRM 88003]|uniref:FeoB-associated Cys-rich membrane protein n=1 Tax=Paractinoplanes aksuensis TaxID=2939490 RepID=A0ABT1DUV2_9ACTN|nr:hypothetical protein [Actinoplanes aksuensis]MCO8274590.1 hypothetical protein [Actinoplanes aksuensis]
MTGAVAVAAFVGLLSLLAGVALGWHLRHTNERCPSCGDQLNRSACEIPASRRDNAAAQRLA